MPVALAPWVMTWKPDGKAGLLSEQPDDRQGEKDAWHGDAVALSHGVPPSIVRAGDAEGAMDRFARLAVNLDLGRGKVKGSAASPRIQSRRRVPRERAADARRIARRNPASREAPVRVGTILGGRYRIDGVLGFGGMGVVYRARDLKLDQEIALKRIRPDRVSPERRETLRREIILSRKVTHENVCRVYDLVEIEGEEFVSMEYLPGQDAQGDRGAREDAAPRARPRDRQGHLQRPGRGAPDRRAAPGPEARERDRRRGRQAAADGLRHRDRELALPGREGRHGPRHAAVPGARAARRARRRARGPTSTRWASCSTRCSRAASRSTTTTRRAWCAA